MRVTRRVVTGALTVAAIFASCSWAAAQTVELKVSHYLPPNHTFQKELLRWGEELAAQSGGRLKLNIFPASQLGPANRQFDLARSGVADIAVGLHGVTPGRYPLTELVSLPYLRPASGGNSAVTSQRLSELAAEFLAREHQGLKILWMAVTNPLMFHTANRQIKTVADFKGLRIRYAGEQFAQIIPALGAVPLPVPPAETQEDALIDRLQRGWIAGAALDTFAAEPLPSSSPLWSMENVIITPHIGGMSETYAEQILPLLIHNVRAFKEDRMSDLRNLVREARP